MICETLGATQKREQERSRKQCKIFNMKTSAAKELHSPMSCDKNGSGMKMGMKDGSNIGLITAIAIYMMLHGHTNNKTQA